MGSGFPISEIYTANWLPTPHSPPFPLAHISYLNYYNSLPISFPAFSLPTSKLLPVIFLQENMMSSLPLKALPSLLNPCKIRAKLPRMIPSLSQSSCVDFSPALFSAPLPFFQTLHGPGIPDCFRSYSDTCSCLHAFTHQISTWSALSLFPHCTALPIFREPTLSAKSSVKLDKSVCFLCCLTLHSDKEYYLTNIC